MVFQSVVLSFQPRFSCTCTCKQNHSFLLIMCHVQLRSFLFQPPEAEDVWTSLRMSIDLVNVSLELLPIQLFEHPDENADYEQLPSLARIDFIKSKFEFESFSDWSKTIDLVSEEVIFEDTRQKGTFYLYICLLAIFRYCLGFFIELVKSKAIFFCNSFLCH